jgi:N6-L-threonylcarbamoyladenine synthase
VVPELASRAHQQNVVPVVHEALKRAGVQKEELSAIAFTRGPGLMGSLLVGVSFAKGLACSLGIPMIDVNHLQGHVLAHFIQAEGEEYDPPTFPFLCLLVSGGNSQIILVKAYNDMQVIGQTIDDAAGEAIDKCSKVMGLGYPGGPIIDKLARRGNPKAYSFSKPHIPDYNYSFSGLKTSFLYSLRDWLKEDPDFIEHHKEDLAASLEATVVDILMNKLRKAAKDLNIKQVAVAGGVSANNGLRNAFRDHARRYGWKVFIPKFGYTTDNAAMIAMTGYFKYLDKQFCTIDLPAYSRVMI